MSLSKRKVMMKNRFENIHSILKTTCKIWLNEIILTHKYISGICAKLEIGASCQVVCPGYFVPAKRFEGADSMIA